MFIQNSRRKNDLSNSKRHSQNRGSSRPKCKNPTLIFHLTSGLQRIPIGPNNPMPPSLVLDLKIKIRARKKHKHYIRRCPLLFPGLYISLWSSVQRFDYTMTLQASSSSSSSSLAMGLPSLTPHLARFPRRTVIRANGKLSPPRNPGRFLWLCHHTLLVSILDFWVLLRLPR